MASLDSLVNGTQTLTMWIMTTMGPTGSEPRGWVSPYVRQDASTTLLKALHEDCW